MWLLPPPLSAENSFRIDKLVNLVNEMGPDIVTLQEIWLNRYLRKIRRKLKKYHLVSSGSKFFNKSGLVTLSIHKPIYTNFHPFNVTPKYSFSEFLARKGLLTANLRKGNKLFSIVNTHTYGGNKGKRGQRIKTKQLRILKEQITLEYPVITAGDFNTTPGKLFQFAKDFISDSKVVPTQSRSDKYTKRRFNRIENRKKKRFYKLDYVLLRTKSENSYIKTNTINSPQISDHRPVFAEVII